MEIEETRAQFAARENSKSLPLTPEIFLFSLCLFVWLCARCVCVLESLSRFSILFIFSAAQTEVNNQFQTAQQDMWVRDNGRWFRNSHFHTAFGGPSMRIRRQYMQPRACHAGMRHSGYELISSAQKNIALLWSASACSISKWTHVRCNIALAYEIRHSCFPQNWSSYFIRSWFLSSWANSARWQRHAIWYDEYFITISRYMASKLGLPWVIENHHASAPSEPNVIMQRIFNYRCVVCRVTQASAHTPEPLLIAIHAHTHTHLSLSRQTPPIHDYDYVMYSLRLQRRWMSLDGNEFIFFVIYRLNVEDTRTAPGPLHRTSLAVIIIISHLRAIPLSHLTHPPDYIVESSRVHVCDDIPAQNPSRSRCSSVQLQFQIIEIALANGEVTSAHRHTIFNSSNKVIDEFKSRRHNEVMEDINRYSDIESF